MRGVTASGRLQLRSWLPVLVPAALGLGVVSACASEVARDGSVYRHRSLGYTVAAPDERWSRIDVEGSVLAFRAPDGATMSMLTRCQKSGAVAAVLARQLLIGLGDRTLRQAGPVLIEGRNGWGQLLDVRNGTRTARLKTITVVVDQCVVDWVLVGTGDFEVAERSFDAWWSTFQVPGPSADAGERP